MSKAGLVPPVVHKLPWSPDGAYKETVAQLRLVLRKEPGNERAVQPELALERNILLPQIDGKPKCKEDIIRDMLIWCERQETPNQYSVSSKPENNFRCRKVPR